MRRRVLELYTRARSDWGQAPFALSRGFREARELRSHERRFVGEAVYGLVRWRRRLAFLVELARGVAPSEAAREGRPEPGPTELYLAWWWAFAWPEAGAGGGAGAAAERAVPGPLEPELARLGLPREGLERGRAALDTLDEEVAPALALAVRESYPDWLTVKLVEERGLADAGALLAAMNRRAPLAARANRLKITRDDLARRLAEEGVAARPLPLSPDGLALETHLNAYGLRAFRDGLFELQDEASQLVGELVAPPPRAVVVDACAGAGGKTLALGALMGNRGRLVALDVSRRKLDELRERARRAGLTNVQAREVPEANVLRLDALPVAPGEADRVLCDAPCSGVGVLRRNPEARWRLGPGDLDELPRTQARILATYAPLVRVGGRLVYATCTVTRAENDAVVEGFLAAHPQFEEVPAKEILGTARAARIGDGQRLRLLPHVHDTDGFFAAVLRRR